MTSWNDDVLRGFNNTIDLFNIVIRERAQLYGSLIAVMNKSNITEVEIPFEEYKQIGLTQYVLFEPTETGLKVTIKEQEKETVE